MPCSTGKGQFMRNVRQWFDEAQAIADPIERSAAMCDLAFDAEGMAKEGEREDAIELAKLLATLDAYDDLLHPAIEAADRILLAFGVRTLPSLESIVESLRHKFSALSERDRQIAVAKSLVREHGLRNPDAWDTALRLLDVASQQQPLTNKELGFRAEVVRHLADSERTRPPHANNS